MTYVDGFVLMVPTKNLAAYRDMAEKAGKIWKEYGALDYKECIGEDLADKGFGGMTFPQLTNLKPDETVIFSFITYKSRTQRDEVNAKIMADPRMKDACDPNNMPFDMKRMAYGGFETIVDL